MKMTANNKLLNESNRHDQALKLLTTVRGENPFSCSYQSAGGDAP
jgi:hypothetical protein